MIKLTEKDIRELVAAETSEIERLEQERRLKILRQLHTVCLLPLFDAKPELQAVELRISRDYGNYRTYVYVKLTAGEWQVCHYCDIPDGLEGDELDVFLDTVDELKYSSIFEHMLGVGVATWSRNGELSFIPK